jgi:hypothetical protein
MTECPKCRSCLLHIVKPFSIQFIVLFQRFSCVMVQLWNVQRIQTKSGTQPLLIPLVLGILPPWEKQLWWNTDHLHPPSIKAKMCGDLPPLPHTPSWHQAWPSTVHRQLHIPATLILKNLILFAEHICPTYDSQYISVTYTAENLNPLTLSYQNVLGQGHGHITDVDWHDDTMICMLQAIHGQFSWQVWMAEGVQTR